MTGRARLAVTEVRGGHLEICPLHSVGRHPDGAFRVAGLRSAGALRDRAAMCRALADKPITRPDAADWLRLAERWERLAEKVEANATDTRDRGGRSADVLRPREQHQASQARAADEGRPSQAASRLRIFTQRPLSSAHETEQQPPLPLSPGDGRATGRPARKRRSRTAPQRSEPQP